MACWVGAGSWGVMLLALVFTDWEPSAWVIGGAMIMTIVAFLKDAAEERLERHKAELRRITGKEWHPS